MDIMLSDPELPEYSPSVPPDYSSTPLPGERCIQRSPKRALGYYHEHHCAFTYEEHGMSLTLRDCREENGVPTFGLCSNVYGEFSPTKREKIVSVAVKLEAQIQVQARLGVVVHTLFSKERKLWQRGDSSNELCPSLLPISLSFPFTYCDKTRDRQYRLPPSMSVTDPCPAAIVYSLNVIVRKAFIFSRTKEVRLSAYLRYSPRVRPPRPPPLSFSSLKANPEEWQEEIWAMTKASSEEGKEPLVAQCHLFVPSIRVFASSETVPFHLTLCCSEPFLGSIASHMTQRVSLEKPIHVFLLRRTSVFIGNWKCIEEEVLGTGRITPNPTTAVEPVSENVMNLSWDGEIECDQSIEHSSFTTTVIEVKDFLVISLLVPPGPLKSIPPKLYQAFPIRLVTHPWLDRS